MYPKASGKSSFDEIERRGRKESRGASSTSYPAPAEERRLLTTLPPLLQQLPSQKDPEMKAKRDL